MMVKSTIISNGELYECVLIDYSHNHKVPAVI